MLANNSAQSVEPSTFQGFYKYESKRQRILIIDDDIEFRLVLSELLVGLGYSISTAKNARAAINSLETLDDSPQLIILDSHMPEGDGKEFLRLQREKFGQVHVPVVLISGDLMASEEFKEEKLAACLMKPLDVLEVIDVIQKKLPLKF